MKKYSGLCSALIKAVQIGLALFTAATSAFGCNCKEEPIDEPVDSSTVLASHNIPGTVTADKNFSMYGEISDADGINRVYLSLDDINKEDDKAIEIDWNKNNGSYEAKGNLKEGTYDATLLVDEGFNDKDQKVYTGRIVAEKEVKELTPLQSLDQKLSQLPDYAQNEAQMLRSEALANGNVTQQELESIVSVVDDPLFLTISKNDDLTYKFDLVNFTSLLKELREAPYSNELMNRITAADSKENVGEAWNYKVRREDEVLFSIIPEYQTGFNGNSAEAWQFRFDNGSYHLNSWLNYKETGNIDTIHILPLDKAGINEWFTNKEDAEFAYMEGLWVPNAIMNIDLTKYEADVWNFRTLRNNMDLIIGNKKVNELNFENLRDRIVSVDQNHELISYPNYYDSTDYLMGNGNWERQTMEGFEGFINTLPDYGKNFVPVLEENWNNFKLIKLAYGLGSIDMIRGEGDVVEQWDCAITAIYSKALGSATFNIGARYPEYTNVEGKHQALGITVPDYILPLLPDNKFVFKGQVIGPYSAIDSVKKDQIPYLTSPNSPEIVWQNK